MHLCVGKIDKRIFHLEAAVMLHHIPVQILAEIDLFDADNIRNISAVNMDLRIKQTVPAKLKQRHIIEPQLFLLAECIIHITLLMSKNNKSVISYSQFRKNVFQ